MIRGIGIDLCHIGDMRTRLEDVASVFAAAHFTPEELAVIRTRASHDPAQHAAARYAAKEAAVKALSQATPEDQWLSCIDYREIEIVGAADAVPRVRFHGNMRRIAETLGIQHVLLSLSHEADMTAAIVVLL